MPFLAGAVRKWLGSDGTTNKMSSTKIIEGKLLWSQGGSERTGQNLYHIPVLAMRPQDVIYLFRNGALGIFKKAGDEAPRTRAMAEHMLK